MNRSQFFQIILSIAITALFVACGSTSNVATTAKHPDITGKENRDNYKKVIETYKVAGNCETCKKRIERAAKNVKGVTQADWDVDNQTLEVVFHSKKTNAAEIQKAVAAAGYDTELFKADTAAYEKLTTCCQYTRMKKN